MSFLDTTLVKNTQTQTIRTERQGWGVLTPSRRFVLHGKGNHQFPVDDGHRIPGCTLGEKLGVAPLEQMYWRSRGLRFAAVTLLTKLTQIR